MQGPEHGYTAEFKVFRLSVCAQGTSSTFFPKTDRRRAICLFCNIGTKALPHKEKSWLMIFVLNLFSYNHWHQSVIYCFWAVEVWCSTMTCFPNLVTLKCGEPIEIKATPVGTIWLIELSLIDSWTSWDLKKSVPSLLGQVAERFDDKAGVWGRGLRRTEKSLW